MYAFTLTKGVNYGTKTASTSTDWLPLEEEAKRLGIERIQQLAYEQQARKKERKEKLEAQRRQR